MHQNYNTRTRIAQELARREAAYAELMYLDDMCQQGGDEYVDSLMAHWNDARDGFDGSLSERMTDRALQYAGLGSARRL